MTKQETTLEAVSKIGKPELVAQHTRTPWKLSGKYILARCDHTDDVVIVRTGSEDNAAFIVRAVNSHKALVEALQEAKAALNGGPNTDGLHIQIHNALKLAKEI